MVGWKASPAVLWPPNAVLLAALLLSPPRTWWIYVLAVLPADRAISFAIPLKLGVGLYASNTIQTLVAASLIQLTWGARRDWSRLGFLITFLMVGVIVGPLVGACFGAATVIGLGAGISYWEAWRGWFVANALTNFTLAPALAIGASAAALALKGVHWNRRAEPFVLFGALLAVCVGVFEIRHEGTEALAALLYAPLPLLLWAAVRFGPGGVSAAQVMVVLVAIHGVAHGRGPFTGGTLSTKVLQLQLFLLAMSLPLTFLAAVVRERLQAIGALETSERDQRRAQGELRRSFGQVQDLAGRLINAQESERAHIARELHDDLSQQLAAMSIGLSALKRKIPESAQQEVLQLQGAAIELANEVRSLSHELHSGVLQHVGLAAALRARCTEFRGRNGCDVEYAADEPLAEIPADVSLCLYRVAQEALGNVVRHAHARRVLVSVSTDARGVELTVRDDGRGFDPAEVRSLGGLGLISLEERVRLVRGNLSIKSEPDRGTELRVRVPVEGRHESREASENPAGG
jgi:two-component system sensor histidine kinase UhpB